MKAILSLLDLIPSWVWALMVVCLSATLGASQMHVGVLKHSVNAAKAETAEVKQQFAEYREAQAAQRAKDEAEARKREKDLQTAADQLRNRKDVEIARLRDDVRNLRYGLQYLPTRPAISASPSTAGTGQAGSVCPGPVLYRETGEELVSEAERAETIRLELLRVYELYDRVREKLGAP